MGFTDPTFVTNTIQSLADQPTETASEVKQAFDKAAADIKTYLTALNDELESTTDGNSGMDNIGMTPIDGVMTTPQQALEYLKTRVDATTPTTNVYSVLDNGLTGDGVTNDATALNALITAIGSKEATILFPALTTGQAIYLIQTNVAFPANVSVVFLNGATLKVDNTYSVTGTNTKLESSLHQIFDLSLGGIIVGTWDVKEIYPQWFGALADGINDDYTPIIQAIEFAINGNLLGVNSSIYFKRGIYKIGTSGVISNADYTGSIQRGLTFKGENPFSSVLLLDATSEMWFYDNGASNEKFERLTFENLGFTSNNISNGNGFSVWSAGGEKQFHFTNCVFGQTVNDSIGVSGGISIGIKTSGTANADLFKFSTCFITIEESLMYLDNAQSVVHEFIGTDIATYGHLIDFGNEGGGSIHIFGGAIELLARGGDTTNRYVVNIPETVAQGISNCEFDFNSVRFELKSAYKGFVSALNKSTGHAIINFYGCNLGTVDGGSRDGFIISPRKKVTLRDCSLSQNIDYLLKNTVAESSSPEAGGLLIIDSCRVGSSASTPLHSRITLEENLGRAIGRNNTTLGSKSITQADAQDFDIGWINAMSRESSPVKKVIAMKPQYLAFPYAGTLETTVTLPPGCIITSVYANKPALGVNTDAYQIFIGSDDKLTIYGQSVLAQQKDQHKIDERGLDIEITSSNNIVRLWANPSGAPTTHPGIAYIEYI